MAKKMKINIYPIIRDHFNTLYDHRTSKISKTDIFIFYVIPIVLSFLFYDFSLEISTDGYNASINFFGIFIALLLNIQVAIFAIFQRKWDSPSDAKIARMQKEKIEDRRILVKELSSNISYLIVVCCIALVFVIICYVEKYTKGIPPAITCFLYVHFLLTLLMIVKRAHALFLKEYTDSP